MTLIDLLTGTKTALIQYLSKLIDQGLIYLPKVESSLTKHTCLEYGVLNQVVCFSCN